MHRLGAPTFCGSKWGPLCGGKSLSLVHRSQENLIPLVDNTLMQLKEDYLFLKPFHFVLVHLTNEALLFPGWQGQRPARTRLGAVIVP